MEIPLSLASFPRKRESKQKQISNLFLYYFSVWIPDQVGDDNTESDVQVSIKK